MAGLPDKTVYIYSTQALGLTPIPAAQVANGLTAQALGTLGGAGRCTQVQAQHAFVDLRPHAHQQAIHVIHGLHQCLCVRGVKLARPGAHLVHQAAGLTVSQRVVGVSAGANRRGTQREEIWAWLCLRCHAGNVVGGGAHGSPLAVVLVDGLQIRNGLLRLCQPLLGRQIAGLRGHQYGLAAVQAVERMHVQCNGVRGVVARGGQRQACSTRQRLCAGHGVRNGVHGSVLLCETETTCTAFSSTKQVDGMLKTRTQTCGHPYG